MCIIRQPLGGCRFHIVDDCIDNFGIFGVATIEFIVRRPADPTWTIRDVIYPSTHTLVWAAAGRAHYVAEGESFEVAAGQMLLIPAGVRRSARSDPGAPWRFDSIGFSLVPSPDPSAAAARLAALTWVVTPPPDVDVPAAVAELDKHWHDPRPGFQLVCRGIVSRLLGLFVQSATRAEGDAIQRPALRRVIELLRRDTRRVYPSDELARRAGLSLSRFRVLFHQATGTSALRFQNGIRVRRAAGLLRTGEYTVSEVALRLGYQDIFYFSRQFKQFTGSPPSAYLPK